jgi:SP family general alpha glucoside:H+ symporter-like MFS transporter
MANLTGEWSYRIPFAVQWVWIIPLFIIATFAPESPWFLVRSGKLKEAERAVARLGKKADTRDPARIVAMMVGERGTSSFVANRQVRTNEHEKERSESLSYVVCHPSNMLVSLH